MNLEIHLPDVNVINNERSPDPNEVSSKTMVTVDLGFHPIVCIFAKVLINLTIAFDF